MVTGLALIGALLIGIIVGIVFTIYIANKVY